MKEQQRNKMAIRIMGQEYTIKGHVSLEQMQKVATYVNDLMSEFSQKNPRISLYKIAILTLINLANDYLQLKEKQNSYGE